MKLKIKDRNGKIYRVTDEAPAAPKKACRDADDLDKDEVALLKKLVPHIEELIALLKVEQDEHDEESFDADKVEESEEESEETVEEEFVEDDDCADEVDETEETEETEEVEKIHDSKKAFGAIERKKVIDSDPELLQADEIALAWEKRYGGK